MWFLMNMATPPLVAAGSSPVRSAGCENDLYPRLCMVLCMLSLASPSLWCSAMLTKSALKLSSEKNLLAVPVHAVMFAT